MAQVCQQCVACRQASETCNSSILRLILAVVFLIKRYFWLVDGNGVWPQFNIKSHQVTKRFLHRVVDIFRKSMDLLWAHRPSKPTIDFLEMLIGIPLGESLCHLVRFDVKLSSRILVFGYLDYFYSKSKIFTIESNF